MHPAVLTKNHNFTSANLFPLTSLTLLAVVVSVHGADPTPATGGPVESLPKTVVTASRAVDDLANVPQSVVVLTSEAIASRQAQTPNQMLREEVGIWSPMVAAQGSPVIRGQIGNRVLYLWDGVRINNGALFSGPNGFFNQFPVGAVDRMEVVRGPGSVQYGSDAIGGVINIVSKKSESFSDTLLAGGETSFRYGTVNNEKTEWLDGWLTEKSLTVSAGISRQDVGDYRGPGAGILRNTGFESTGGYLNLALRPVADHTVRLSWIQNSRDNVDSYVQSKLNPSGIPRIFSPNEERSIGKLEYQIDNLGLLSSELKAYGYAQYYDQARERRVESATALSNTRTDTRQDVYGAGIQNITPLSTSWGDHRLVYGLDFRTENLRTAQKLLRTAIPSGALTTSTPLGKVPDGIYDSLDGFILTELHPFEPLTLTAGGRVEQTRLQSRPTALDVIPNAGYSLADLQVDKTWTSGTWNVGAVYKALPQLDLAGNIATGFRAPTFSDALSTGTPVFSSKTASLPSPNVNPENFVSYEIGPRLHAGDLSASLSAYWTALSDLVRQANTGTVTIPGQGTFIAMRSSNAGGGYVRGLEFAVSYRIGRAWTVFGNATYTEGRDTHFNENLRFIPPLNGVVGIRYDSENGRWWAEAVEVLVDRLGTHAPNDELDAGFSTDPALGSPNTDPTKGPLNPPLHANFIIPGYVVTNLRFGVQLWSGTGHRRLDFTLDLNNLLDARYREPLAQQEYVAPGFNCVAGLRLKF